MGWFTYAFLKYQVCNIKGTWSTALLPEMSLYGRLRTGFTGIYERSREGCLMNLTVRCFAWVSNTVKH